jgi:aminoglycoside phosphotransferase (APT) family kinase protein
LDTPDPALAQARDAAQALVGAGVEVRHRLGGGRNSRIYHVRHGHREFALKQYPSQRDDPRDRLATEMGALRLMERNHLDMVPRVIGVDRDRGYALLTWIEGAEVTTVEDKDIDAAVAFLAAIHALREAPTAGEQPPAAEACLSGREIERQIDERLARLRALAADQTDLGDFLADCFVPTIERALAEARRKMQAADLDFAADVPQEWRSLVPSDFGFHNSLRRRDGSLAFIDFEYFGWDDPVKLTADILLHPGRPLDGPQRRRFRRSVVRLYGQGRQFEARLAAYLPLFGLRWVLILLNEFIPERWRRRQLAGASETWSQAKSRQLGSARAFLAALDQKVED